MRDHITWEQNLHENYERMYIFWKSHASRWCYLRKIKTWNHVIRYVYLFSCHENVRFIFVKKHKNKNKFLMEVWVHANFDVELSVRDELLCIPYEVWDLIGSTSGIIQLKCELVQNQISKHIFLYSFVCFHENSAKDTCFLISLPHYSWIWTLSVRNTVIEGNYIIFYYNVAMWSPSKKNHKHFVQPNASYYSFHGTFFVVGHLSLSLPLDFRF